MVFGYEFISFKNQNWTDKTKFNLSSSFEVHAWWTKTESSKVHWLRLWLSKSWKQKKNHFSGHCMCDALILMDELNDWLIVFAIRCGWGIMSPIVNQSNTFALDPNLYFIFYFYFLCVCLCCIPFLLFNDLKLDNAITCAHNPKIRIKYLLAFFFFFFLSPIISHTAATSQRL